jgi:hypothetical protein
MQLRYNNLLPNTCFKQEYYVSLYLVTRKNTFKK